MTGGGVQVSGQSTVIPQGSEDVVIGDDFVQIPLGRILLIHKGSGYCAVKFTAAWTGKTEEDRYATYESYYQGDGTGDFLNKNVQFKKGDLILRRTVGLGHPRFPVGCTKTRVRCGPTELVGYALRYVYFPAETDYAPTEWTDISQVNVFDPRLKWYKNDYRRKVIRIPVDQLWENGEDKK